MPEVHLGPFCVRTERATIETYRNATGARGRDVPAAFPICWLGREEIRTAIGTSCGRRLPLHEAQSFDYLRPLVAEADYRLSLSLAEQADPPRLVVKGECSTPAGELCLRMETLLRLVAPDLEGAA